MDKEMKKREPQFNTEGTDASLVKRGATNCFCSTHKAKRGFAV